MISFFLEKDAPWDAEVRYILGTWAKSANEEIRFAEHADNAVTVGDHPQATVRVQRDWSLSRLATLAPDAEGYFHFPDTGQPDYLLTAFHHINSLQEYSGNDLDDLGRFRFDRSFQYRSQKTSDNIVQRCFDQVSQLLKRTIPARKTQFFLTHDIDMVNGALLEDGFNVLKKGRIDIFLRLLFNAAIGKPDWLNIDQILKIESEYDCKSTFYWLVNKGVINKRERNADYTFASPNIQRQYRNVEEQGSENGIHKSISPETFEGEFAKFGRKPFGNRYHYLKFTLPQAYNDIENSGLKLDASLGFAEAPGFRNNYGLPFNPYHFAQRRPYSFVEVPLHVMDRTFFQYQKVDVAEAERRIIAFFEQNKENCVLSVLWHNNFFSNYKFKGYLPLYKRILSYIHENRFQTISQKEIFDSYSLVK